MNCAEYLYGNDVINKLTAVAWITGYVSAANEMLETKNLQQINASTIQWDAIIKAQCQGDMNMTIGNVARNLVKLHLQYNISNR